MIFRSSFIIRISLLAFSIVLSLLVSGAKIYSNNIHNPQADGWSGKVVESSVSFLSEAYIPGSTVNLQFYYTYSSPDGEWDDGVSLDFPDGVFVNSASVCTTTGVQQLPYNGETGDGALITWGNMEGGSGFGGLRSSGLFWVNGTISEDFTDSLYVDWFIAGDGL